MNSFIAAAVLAAILVQCEAGFEWSGGYSGEIDLDWNVLGERRHYAVWKLAGDWLGGGLGRSKTLTSPSDSNVYGGGLDISGGDDGGSKEWSSGGLGIWSGDWW